jgi:DivIVA domain-containing protein
MTNSPTGDPLSPRRLRGGPVRLTPETVRNLEFPRTALGRRGYCEIEVERFRARVVEEIAKSDRVKAELREEIGRLRAYFRQRAVGPANESNGQNGSNGANGGEHLPAARDDMAPSVQAVNVLSQAQQAADAHIAQAQEYARRLITEARARYEQILTQAQQQAAQAAEEAARNYQSRMAGPDPRREEERQQLEAKIAYLRTFARLTQVQLKSALDGLGHELDRLTEMPSPAVVDPGVDEELVRSGG